MKDAVATMGTRLDDSIQGRDAVHVAVVATRAAVDLLPGQDVGKDGSTKDPVGIVDPFLKDPVVAGERFWLFLYPRTITGLSHTWTHPAFDGGAKVAPLLRAHTEDQIKHSDEWLRAFCKTANCPDYQILINAAVGDHHLNDKGDGYRRSQDDAYGKDTYLHFGGWDAHGQIPVEFWNHVEIVTDRTIPAERRAKYFSCSC